ncbi:MAG: YciI family protein [Nitrospira sp.]|jgi:hypothetical protein|nr:YciI family protein [Nitrospira sp.]MCC7470121.1 YciI family protein [Candidatus Nomurabacteria bacterium]
MKFILLVHHDEAVFEQLDEERKRSLLSDSIGLCHQLETQGQYVHASPVHPAATATLVRVKDGKAVVTDGPFIETREQMAGYFLIEAKDHAEAVAVALRVPGATIGTVEVRPVRDVTGLP